MREIEFLIKRAADEASMATALQLRDLSNISKLVKSAGLDAIPKIVNFGKGAWNAAKGWAKAHPYAAHVTNTGVTTLGTLGTVALLSGGDADEANAAVRKSQEEKQNSQQVTGQRKNSGKGLWDEFKDLASKYKYTGIGGLVGGGLGLGLSGGSTSDKVLSALLGTALGGGAGWVLDNYL